MEGVEVAESLGDAATLPVGASDLDQAFGVLLDAAGDGGLGDDPGVYGCVFGVGTGGHEGVRVHRCQPGGPFSGGGEQAEDVVGGRLGVRKRVVGQGAEQRGVGRPVEVRGGDGATDRRDEIGLEEECAEEGLLGGDDGLDRGAPARTGGW
ncbi:hypothetical protein GCM10023205_04190 [Yinghuangia aomiensis]|uniref:Uncharacterized protein n=1 Tax=Yinghuangia aomiensis TaxID=676205 RepID=A0ABP9GV15_9ACTN